MSLEKNQRISDLERELGKKSTALEKVNKASESQQKELESLRKVEGESRKVDGKLEELSGKYSESLRLLSERVGGKERKTDTLRRNRDNWARKIELAQNGERLAAQVKFDLFELMYKKNKESKST